MRRARALLLVAVIAGVAFLVPEPPAAAATGYTSAISLVSPGELWASWRPGCPVGPEQLRRVTVSHWGFDGTVHTGRLIVHAELAGEVAGIFRDLYAHGFPIQLMQPVDAYNGSDDASMAANNTSAFNCRPVTGGTTWSQHAFGRAIDINPVQNPYVRGSTVLPPAGRAYLDRGSPATGKILAGDHVVQVFASRGWEWGGYWTSPKDYQHMQRAGAPARPLPANAGASVSVTGTGRLELLLRAGTGELIHRTRTAGGWSGPGSLGGYLDSTPDAASWAPGRLDVVGLGGDGAIWHRAQEGSTWYPWQNLGGQSRSGPATVSWGPNRLDIFIRGMDDALWANAWTGTGWTGWHSLGGLLTADPDVASWGSGRLDVFVRGADGAVWHRGFQHGTWWPWEPLGGIATSGAGAASRSPGTVDAFVRGADGALYGNSWTGANWTGWFALGGLLTSDPDVAVASGGALTVVASGGDDALWARTLAGGWGPWHPLL